MEEREGATGEEGYKEKREENRQTYIPGRGTWVIKKAHGLGRWPPLHITREVHPPNISLYGRLYVVICGREGLRSSRPLPNLKPNICVFVTFSGPVTRCKVRLATLKRWP